MGRLVIKKRCRISGSLKFGFLSFQKPNKKPDSHDKHASTHNSRYDKLHTQNSSQKSIFYWNSMKTIITLYEIVHDTGQSSLFRPALLKLIHDPESVYSPLDPKNTLQPHNTTGPHSRRYRVRVTAIDGIPLTECCTGGKPGPVTHKALSAGQVISGQLDPLVLTQTFHWLTSFQNWKPMGESIDFQRFVTINLHIAVQTGSSWPLPWPSAQQHTSPGTQHQQHRKTQPDTFSIARSSRGWS